MNGKFVLYWNPVENVTLYSQGYELEVLELGNDYYILKQMKENPFQDADVSTESTFNVNNVKNIKEDGSLQGINYRNNSK